MRKGNRILAGLAAVLAACGGTSAAPPPAPDDGVTPAFLQVENQSYTDFNVYVIRNETRKRLGRSTATTTTAFKIPGDLLTGQSRIKFGADPIGRQVIGITRELTVVPGDTVVLIIPPA
jgi:hypothetical protein